MRNLIGRWLAGVILVSLLGGSAWAQQGRLATVDLRKVFDSYWKTKQADAALKERAADMEKEHSSLIKDWKKAKEDYQSLLADANNQAISSEEREKRKKAAEDKLKQIKENEETIGQFERTARSTIDEQRKRMRDNIVEEIRTVLNSKAKTAGFALVLDTSADSANLTPIVLYNNNENDLTKSLLEQLNANAPAPEETPAKTTEKKDEKKK